MVVRKALLIKLFIHPVLTSRVHMIVTHCVQAATRIPLDLQNLEGLSSGVHNEAHAGSLCFIITYRACANDAYPHI